MGSSRMPMWLRLDWVLTPLYKALRRHGIGWWKVQMAWHGTRAWAGVLDKGNERSWGAHGVRGGGAT